MFTSHKLNIEHSKNSKFIWTVSIISVVIFMTVVALITYLHNIKEADSTSWFLLQEVQMVLDHNQEEEATLKESLKENYISRAKLVESILSQDQSIFDDKERLEEVAKLVSVEEINIFNNEGVIVAGTVPEYYGMSIADGDQIGFFEPMLKDKSLSLCQDITPNSAEGKDMMYAMVWSDTGEYMVQVGVTPESLYTELISLTINDVIYSMPMTEGLSIYAINNETGLIEGATDNDRIGQFIDDFDIDAKNITYNKCQTKKIDGKLYRLLLNHSVDYDIAILYEMSAIQHDLGATLLMVFLLILAFIVTVNIILNFTRKKNRLTEEELASSIKARDEQFEIMKSMSEMYYSMHYIDLENNTFQEYNAKAEVSKYIYDTQNIKELMDYIMIKRSSEEFRKDMLEFCNIDTVRSRMKNVKSIYRDFLGPHGHWYRANFITIKKDEEGFPSSLIFAVQSVDEEKRREERLLLNSTTDRLSGCLNRRALDEAKDNILSEGIPDDLVYISMDVNGLKNINDSLGHMAGDELIVGAANCMREAFSSFGNIYRVGGDEFAALLNISSAELEKRIERFNLITSNWSGEYIKSISIACGYVFGKETDDFNQMAMLADKRMYEAKAIHYKNSSEHRRNSGDEFK